MKKCLIIKTSSLGDILHTLPALTEASSHITDIEFSWVVEKPFSEVPSWHKSVGEVLEVEIRKWRKNIFKYFNEVCSFRNKIQSKYYDYIIDAQGLLKSALIAKVSKGRSIYGFDSSSSREPLSSLFYQNKISVNKKKHAIFRSKELFSKVFNYKVSEKIDYGISYQNNHKANTHKKIIFFHTTTWLNKKWPIEHWQELIELLEKNDIKVFLPWGNNNEKVQAYEIAKDYKNVILLPKMSLTDLTNYFKKIDAAISVDTGLCHLATAFNIPVVSIYGPTSPELTGTIGKKMINISSQLSCSPCLKRVCPINKLTSFAPCQTGISPKLVYKQLLYILSY